MNKLLDVKNLGVLVGVLLVIGLGTYWVQQSMERKEQEGKTALYKIQKTYEEEMKAVPEEDRAPGAVFDVDAKLSKTVSELNGLVNAKSASKHILYEAALRLGSLYMEHGQAEKARAVLEKTTQFADTSFQKASAYFVLGVSEERSLHYKEAAHAFSEGLAKNIEGLNSEFLLGLVRTSLKLEDKGKAKQYAERINKDFPSSHAATLAQEWVK